MKRRFWTGLLLCCFVSAAAIAEASDLFGTVRLKGQPLPNTVVTLKDGREDLQTKTNLRGYYSLRDIEPGKYTLVIQLHDRSTRQVPVYVFPQSTEKNIDLK